jgi:uncharacterized protein (DUF1499 family)
MDYLLLALTLAVLNSSSTEGAGRPGDQAPKRLADCPGKPNCVSTEANAAKHAVAPLRLKGDPALAWEGIREIAAQLPHSEVVRSTDRYLHVIYKSRFFGFVDDLELLWDPGTDRVAIRSASRTGYSDLGVNRRRVEELRQRFKAKALIE